MTETLEQNEKLTYEKAVSRLDKIVRELESGQAPLDASLTLFEEGTELIRVCTKMLDDAEQKVTRLAKGPDSEPLEYPFEPIE